MQRALAACGAEPAQLRAGLQLHLDTQALQQPPGDTHAALPDLGLQRVLQSAVYHAKASGRHEATCLDALAAIFSEPHSHAVLLLTSARVSRLDLEHYLAQQQSP